MSATVVADDRRGLFCAVAGVLALHGLDILGATATTEPMAWPSTRSTCSRCWTASRGGTSWSATSEPCSTGRCRSTRAAGPAPAGVRRRARPLAARPPAIDVQFLDHVSDTSTVIDVRGPASLGALYRITRQFAELDLDIRHARVTTIGNQAVDSFYLVDGDAGPSPIRRGGGASSTPSSVTSPPCSRRRC